MSKKKINKEEINDFDDLKNLLLNHLSGQNQENSEAKMEGNDSYSEDTAKYFKLIDDSKKVTDASPQEIQNNTNQISKISDSKPLAKKKSAKQQEINDFDDLKDLLLKNLSKQNPEINEEKIEEDDPFMKDAFEGLQLIKEKGEIDNSVLSINNNLNKLLETRKERKRKRAIPSNQWNLLAVGIVLLLAILVYFVIHLQGK